MPNEKKIIIFFVIIILIIAGFFIVYFKSKIFKLAGPNNADINNGQSTAPIEGDEFTIYPPSVPAGNTEECEKEKDAGKKNLCYFSLAIYDNKIEFCDKILNDENLFAECKDSLKYNEIILSGDVYRCKELAESKQDACQNEFFRSWKDINSCTGLDGELKTNCNDIINHKKAYQEGDEKICDSIGNEVLKSDCLGAVSKKEKDADNDGIDNSDEKSYGTDLFKADTDDDGLNDYDEIFVYFTNPRLADTDGDGHKDGDEVKNGYNPMGQGKLN